MAMYCGIDWAEGHHDIALVDDEGRLVAKRRIAESLDGVAELTAMLAAAGDSAEEPIPVAIETPRGLLVAVLRASGRPIYPINPLAVARYRERTSVSGKKSDHVDAMALANILRTDAHLHRLAARRLAGWPARSPCWPAPTRTRCGGAPNWSRSCGPGCASITPGSSAAFAAGSGPGVDVHHAAGQRRRPRGAGDRPQPGRGSDGVQGAGRDSAASGRPAAAHRHAVAAGSSAALRVPQLRQDPLVEQAMRTEPWPCSACSTRSATRSTSWPPRLIEAFAPAPGPRDHHQLPRPGRHLRRDRARRDRRRPRPVRRRPGAAGLRRLRPGHPRLGQVPHRVRRRTKNNRLAAIGYSWAFTAAARPSPTRDHYLRRRDRGDGHPAALRHLFNRMLGQLHHCLATGQTYNPIKAFPAPRRCRPQPPNRSARLTSSRHRRSQAIRGPVGEGGDEVSVARFIADQRTFYRVPYAVCCAMLGVSVSWFYKWLDRPATARQRRRAALDADGAEMFTASERSYGSPRMHADLLEDGWTVSEKTVADSMRRQGLLGREPRRRNGLTKQDKTAPKFPDLLKRDFTAPAPNPRWWAT